MPKRSKPAAVTIVAILNIVVALPCMCCMGFNAVGLAAMGGGAANQPKPAANDPFGQAMAQSNEQINFLAKEAPGYKAEQIGYNVVAVLCSLVLLIASIGLFMGQAWGRMATIAACAVMILIALGNAVYSAAFIVPAATKFQEQKVAQQAGPPPPKGAFEAGGVIGICLGVLVGAGYPAAAIAMLMTGSVREYFASRSRRDEHDEYRRDDDYDQRDDAEPPRGRPDNEDYDDRFRG